MGAKTLREENPVNDESVKALCTEIMNDVELSRGETEEQLLQVIELNKLNVNQTSKINRLISGLATNGISYGQALIDAEAFSETGE